MSAVKIGIAIGIMCVLAWVIYTELCIYNTPVAIIAVLIFCVFAGALVIIFSVIDMKQEEMNKYGK